MSCGLTFPFPEETDNVLILSGEAKVIKNFAMSAILHCVNAKRFCCYIGDSAGSFESFTALDECTFNTDSYDFLIPKNATCAETTLRRIKEVDRKYNPALTIVEVPSSCTPYGIVNILGHLQDLQLRLKLTCLILVAGMEIDTVMSERLLEFYKLKVYRATRWSLETKAGETAVSFTENEGHLTRDL